MTEVEHLLDQLTRVFEGDSWHGPSVTEAITGVTATQAFARPIDGAHTIAELVAHITAWEAWTRKSLRTEEGNTLTDAENFPAFNDTSEAAWKGLVQTMVAGHIVLRAAIAAYDPLRLDTIPPGAKLPAHAIINFAIQHDVYHAGQIMLLRKAAAA